MLGIFLSLFILVHRSVQKIDILRSAKSPDFVVRGKKEILRGRFRFCRVGFFCADCTKLLNLLIKYHSQSGSFSQSAGKPIARTSIVGYSANTDLSFCVNRLFGETVKSRYLIIQMR